MTIEITAVTDWETAFIEQISRIKKELQIARRNDDKSDIENIERWLNATVQAKSLYEEGIAAEDIPSSLQKQGVDLRFPEQEELCRALQEDDFELMLDW